MDNEESKLYVAFLWHMHQPFYKDLLTKRHVLPWVRLHAVKDYYFMASILDRHPTIRQNFNMVPSLLTQLEDFCGQHVDEPFLTLSRKPFSELANDDKIFILQNFFMANRDTMISVFPRYDSLLEKRGGDVSFEALEKKLPLFSSQDFLNIQVWFNLTWIHPELRETDPELKAVSERGTGFTEEDKVRVLDKQLAIMCRIAPKYAELSRKGQIEISMTPFYHPILPLLCDTDKARQAMPGTNLPSHRFMHPEDAERQIHLSIEYFQRQFGSRPLGMWPSEGAVSEDVAALAAEAGIAWIASDEDVLNLSLGRSGGQDKREDPKYLSSLYQPYWVEKDRRKTAIVFRDKTLADKIGFVYKNWPEVRAADDFVEHLKRLKNKLKGIPGPHLVSIILDGENAWEYYPEGGHKFLDRLYTRLEESPSLETIPIGDFIKQHPPRDTLPKLHAGSWINANYGVWIGGTEENRSWDFLSEARAALEDFEVHHAKSDDRDRLDLAWECLYAAEGSDWNWWYGDQHSTEYAEIFDALYRKHLKNVYEIIGLDPPASLLEPILSRRARTEEGLAGYIDPILDGRDSHFYEWLPAGVFNVKDSGGAMHQAEAAMMAIYYGFNAENLFMRVDLRSQLMNGPREVLELDVHITSPSQKKLRITLANHDGKPQATLTEGEDNGQDTPSADLEVAVDRVIEVTAPFESLGAETGDVIKFIVRLMKNGEQLERQPQHDTIALTVPTSDFILRNWYV